MPIHGDGAGQAQALRFLGLYLRMPLTRFPFARAYSVGVLNPVCGLLRSLFYAHRSSFRQEAAEEEEEDQKAGNGKANGVADGRKKKKDKHGDDDGDDDEEDQDVEEEEEEDGRDRRRSSKKDRKSGGSSSRRSGDHHHRHRSSSGRDRDREKGSSRCARPRVYVCVSFFLFFCSSHVCVWLRVYMCVFAMIVYSRFRRKR